MPIQGVDIPPPPPPRKANIDRRADRVYLATAASLTCARGRERPTWNHRAAGNATDPGKCGPACLCQGRTGAERLRLLLLLLLLKLRRLTPDVAPSGRACKVEQRARARDTTCTWKIILSWEIRRDKCEVAQQYPDHIPRAPACTTHAAVVTATTIALLATRGGLVSGFAKFPAEEGSRSERAMNARRAPAHGFRDLLLGNLSRWRNEGSRLKN